MLDSMCGLTGGCGKGSAQGSWLAADLAASKAMCTLAIWHEPLFSSGEHGNYKGAAPFWEALYAAGADVVVNGHDHDYDGSRRRTRTATRTAPAASASSSSGPVAPSCARSRTPSRTASSVPP